VKVGGERAYRLARRGEQVELPERVVEVHRFEQLWRRHDRAGFLIECSAGTYVRSLIADLGDAYCEQLRRTAIGPFRVDEADPARVVPLGDALAFLPSVELAGEDARRAGHGVAVEGAAMGHVLLVDADGPIAVAEPRDGGLLKPIVGFRA
jgi:tRNA pseudouridine55 synthase